MIDWNEFLKAVISRDCQFYEPSASSKSLWISLTVADNPDHRKEERAES